ncbi:Ankyrin repeat-containing protein NPR4, partial [Linum grandiflorum]
MVDIALDLLRRRKGIATVMNGSGVNVAIQLSTMPDAFPSGSPMVFWMRWIYSLVQVKLPDALYASRDEGSVTDSSEEDDGFGLMTSPDGDDIIKDVDKYWKSKHGRVQEHKWSSKLHSFIIYVTGTKHIHELKRVHKCSLELLNLTFHQISRSDFRKLEAMGVYEALDNAVKKGIVEFVKRAIEVCPDLLHRVDNNGRNVLMLAVEFRQEKMFNMLLSSLPDVATTVSLADKDGNTVLHLAGMLPYDDAKLSRISGAALQMQRELHWFLAVERVINPIYKHKKNINNETARQIFTRSHKRLASSGEKWMKETATSATVVGALIITIMFTAVFTVPGGNNQETGIPILLNQWAFKIFVVSDSISQFAASTSVLMFLAVLTSRYSEADFLRSLPTKMVIGLSMLFISIATMMVAFSATIVIVMDRQMECVVPIILLATVPVSLFMLLQFPLLVEIFLSTYGFGIFK